MNRGRRWPHPTRSPKGSPTAMGTVLAIGLTILLVVNGTTASAINCTKGKSCGNSCISKDKTCHMGQPTVPALPKPSAAPEPHSKIERSKGKRAAFVTSHPCPSTMNTSGSCPGYEVDHINPLACGGSDEPSNMQWLSTEENRRKAALGCRVH
jgi:hypothetical protein